MKCKCFMEVVKKIKWKFKLTCLLSTHPVDPVFSVAVRIYKVHVIDEAFFSLFLLNTETNSFNTFIQLINPNYA